MERKFQKFEEWYANANDIVAFFFISGKKSGENLHEHTFMHHDHHPISIVFPLQLPNTIFILWFSLYWNKQIFITFLPPPLPSHVYWSVKHKEKTWAILFRIFSKIKKAELRTYFVCSHTFSYKIQMQTKFHRACASWALIRLCSVACKCVLIRHNKQFSNIVQGHVSEKSFSWTFYEHSSFFAETYSLNGAESKKSCLQFFQSHLGLFYAN